MEGIYILHFNGWIDRQMKLTYGPEVDEDVKLYDCHEFGFIIYEIAKNFCH